MKLVVIGGVAGGASAAARVRRLDEKAEIVVFERGKDVSYSNCALPYYLGGVIEKPETLIMMTPEAFKKRHNIDVRVNSEVVKIDREAKKVAVRDTLTGETYEESYDKLVLSPGARPVMPKSIAGIDRENVFSIRNVGDVVRIKEYLTAREAKDVAVVGGGFIGIEAAENLKKAGYNVSIIEGLGQVLSPFDYDSVQYLHKELFDNGVALHLGSTVSAVTENGVKAVKDGKGFEVRADAVIMAIGVAPENGLARDCGLETGKTGGIKVNERFQTADPDIYAVGDAVETFSRITGLEGRLALAGPAQKEARIAADNICGIDSKYKGFIGSSCIRVFGLNAASTGLNEKAARDAGLKFDSVTVFPPDKVGIMPGSNYMLFKLIFEVPGGRILGAQAIGRGDAVKRADSAAALISMGATVEDLADFEHCYQPMYSTAKDVVHMAALVAENLLSGRMRQVHVSEVRGLVESGAYILDVREPGEYAASHIKGAHNIPTTALRLRLDEIPRDVPVYLHCRTSQRSYYAYCCLRDNGFDNIYNISGSFLGISLYEYFNDMTTGRESILTGYNFA